MRIGRIARGGAITVALACAVACASEEHAVKSDPVKQDDVAQKDEPHEDTPLEIARQTHDYAPWSYAGDDGPDRWGGLDPHYAVCGGGPGQSPVDIVAASAKSHHTSLRIDYRPAELHAFNNGHTVQLNAERDDDHLIVNDHAYKLIQLHIHAPSEHRVDGVVFPMEIHFVHIDEFDHLAVLGLPVKVGVENAILKPLFDNLPKHGGEHVDRETETVELPRLIKDATHFFHYTGSLTTPPCSENVQWFVLETPIEASQAQLDAFAAVVHDNARPPQQMNNRVLVRNEVADAAADAPAPAAE
jgi:carbonic anhydrase